MVAKQSLLNTNNRHRRLQQCHIEKNFLGSQRKMTTRPIQTMLLAAASAVLAGCGGAYDASLTGRVTLDGNVLPRGTVAFHPVVGGPAAYSTIEEDGSYRVRTGREDGLPAGEYDVTVTAHEPSTITQTATGGPPPPGKAITPAWYRAKDTSGLRLTVTPGRNKIDLELSSQPPPGWNPRASR
jgi:hypothetical protein